MRKISVLLIVALGLSACNSVYVKPNTLDATQVFYVDRGGAQLKHAIKEQLEQRGYNVTVGHKRSSISTTYITAESNESVIDASDVGRARYIIQISESAPILRPFWCSLNGFWWWRFNMSIADNVTGQELLGWSGRGCANSSVRKLNKILDKMEQ